MSLTPGLTTALDLLGKLQRDAELLNQGVSSDRFFNFVITGYSLIDWIKHDKSVPERARAPDAIQTLHAEPWLKVCGDLATAAKHFAITRRKTVTTDASAKTGYGVARYGKGFHGTGEEEIEITIDSNGSYTALEFVSGVLGAWVRFFSSHGLSTPPDLRLK